MNLRTTFQILAGFLTLFSVSAASGNNVSVSYRNGDVSIEGDDRSNSIVIRNLGFYVHEIRGLNGTLINGGTRPVSVPILDDLTINMEDGNDTVRLKSVRLTESSHADLTVKLGEGDDNLAIQNSFIARYLDVLCNSRRVDNDSIEIEFTRAEHADIQTQDASDVTLIYNEFRLRLDSGSSGGDKLDIIGNTFGYGLRIDTSDENDDLFFYGNRVETDYFNGIYLHGGDDLATVWMEFYHHRFPSPWPLRLSGGAGFDLMTLKGSGNITRTGFEFVND